MNYKIETQVNEFVNLLKYRYPESNFLLSDIDEKMGVFSIYNNAADSFTNFTFVKICDRQSRVYEESLGIKAVHRCGLGNEWDIMVFADADNAQAYTFMPF